MGERLILPGVLVLAGLVVLGIGVKQRRGTLRRNPIAGLRTSETMRSDQAWTAAHSATAGSVIAAGLVSILGGATIGLLDLDEDRAAVAALGVGAVILSLVATAGIRGHRIARTVNRRSPEG